MKPEPSNQDIMDKLNEIESLIRDGVSDAVIPEDGVSDIQGPGLISDEVIDDTEQAKTLQESAFTRQSFRIGLLDDSYVQTDTN